MQLLCCIAYLGLLWLLGWAGLTLLLGNGERHWADLAGLAWAMGYGLMGAILFGCSLCGWVPSGAVLLTIAVVALVITIALKQRWPRRWMQPSSNLGRTRIHFRLLGGLGILLLAVAAVNVSMSSLGTRGFADIDSFGDWMFKTKILAALPLRPIPPPLLDPTFSYSHQDYPLAVPLVAAGMNAAAGTSDEMPLKLLLIPIYLSLMAVLYAAVRRHLGPMMAAAVTAAFVASPVVSQNAALPVAEVPLALMHGCCIVLLLEWIRGGGRGVLLSSAAFAAFAGFTKNEGLGLAGIVGAVAIAAAMWQTTDRKRALGDVGVAALLLIVLLGPWLVYRRFLPHTHEDYGGKITSMATVIGDLPRLRTVLPGFLSYLFNLNESGMLWIVLAVVAIVGWRWWKDKAVILLWALLLLHIGLYVLVFMITPWKLDVLIPMVGPKLLMHAGPAAVLLIALHLRNVHEHKAPIS